MIRLVLVVATWYTAAARIAGDAGEVNARRISECGVVATLRTALAAGGAELEGHKSFSMDTCGFDRVDAALIADVLRHPHGRLETLVLGGRYMPDTDLALILNASHARGTLNMLKINSCQLGSDGGEVLVDFFRAVSSTELTFVDFQDNDIGFGVCQNLLEWGDKRDVELNLDGNPLISEIGNAVTHGIGEILALVGTALMAKRMQGKPTHYKWALMTYCVSLDLLYLMSVLHHSFFGLGSTVMHIFFVLDTSLVFLVILGTFTPLLAILFHGRTWAVVLHVIMVVSAIFGIVVNFFSDPWVPYVRMPLFLAMGWSAVLCMYPIAKKVGKQGAWLLLLGGIFYSVGVIFDLRRRWFLAIPDHTTWHVFVVCGSMVHYQLIYQRVATYVDESEESKEPLCPDDGPPRIGSGLSLSFVEPAKAADEPPRLGASDFSAVQSIQ